MRSNENLFIGFDPQEKPFFNVTFTVKDKEQFKDTMQEIYNKDMSHGKIPFIIGIMSILIMIPVAKNLPIIQVLGNIP